MELTVIDIIAKKVLSGIGSADIQEGNIIFLQINEETVIKEEVPKGKKWHIIFNLTIDETDA